MVRVYASVRADLYPNAQCVIFMGAIAIQFLSPNICLLNDNDDDDNYRER